jgi:hypothetical protein
VYKDVEARLADGSSTNPLRIELQITGTIKKVTITADDITKSKIILFGRRSSAVFPKHWWKILKRYRSFQHSTLVLLQLCNEVHNDPIHSHQLVNVFSRMQLKFDRQNAKTAKQKAEQELESVEQKLLEAKETIEKMQSGTEQETQIKAFIKYVEGVYKKAIQRSASGDYQKYSMVELILPEEEDDILQHFQEDILLVASSRMKENGQNQPLQLCPRIELRRALDNFLAHRRVKHPKELVHWASAFTMGQIAKGDSQRKVTPNVVRGYVTQVKTTQKCLSARGEVMMNEIRESSSNFK